MAEQKLASLQNLKDVATRIKKEYLSAISKSRKELMQVAESVPTAGEAQENTLYLVKNTATGRYGIYALVYGSVERIGDMENVFSSLAEAQEYARTSEKAHIGQELTVIENGSARKYIIKTAGELEALGADGVEAASDDEISEMFNDVFGSTN